MLNSIVVLLAKRVYRKPFCLFEFVLVARATKTHWFEGKKTGLLAPYRRKAVVVKTSFNLTHGHAPNWLLVSVPHKKVFSVLINWKRRILPLPASLKPINTNHPHKLPVRYIPNLKNVLPLGWYRCYFTPSAKSILRGARPVSAET